MFILETRKTIIFEGKSISFDIPKACVSSNIHHHIRHSIHTAISHSRRESRNMALAPLPLFYSRRSIRYSRAEHSSGAPVSWQKLKRKTGFSLSIAFGCVTFGRADSSFSSASKCEISVLRVKLVWISLKTNAAEVTNKRSYLRIWLASSYDVKIQ